MTTMTPERVGILVACALIPLAFATAPLVAALLPVLEAQLAQLGVTIESNPDPQPPFLTLPAYVLPLLMATCMAALWWLARPLPPRHTGLGPRAEDGHDVHDSRV
jgi:hypothetical protein